MINYKLNIHYKQDSLKFTSLKLCFDPLFENILKFIQIKTILKS
jgi:hypothetical protein